jgi:hypothetical protein
MVFIYKIVDNTNGNIYVGSTKDLSKRKSKHIHVRDCSSKIIIDNEDYEFIVIEECDESLRYIREQHFKENLNNVINQREAYIKDYDSYKKKYNKQYHEKNKEKSRQKGREYREKNKQEILQKEKIWRDNNKEEIKRKNKNWCDKNREEIKRRNDYVKSFGGYPQTNNNLISIDINLFV